MGPFTSHLRHAIGPATQVACQFGLWAVILLAPRSMSANEAASLLAMLALTQTLGGFCEAGLSNAALPSLLYGDRKSTRSTISGLVTVKLIIALFVGVPAFLIASDRMSLESNFAMGIVLLVILTLRTPTLYVSPRWGPAMALADIIGLLLGFVLLLGATYSDVRSFNVLLWTVILMRAGGALVSAYGLIYWRESLSSIKSICGDGIPFAAHKFLTNISHYSTSTIVISIRGSNGLMSYLFAERVYYAGLALFGSFLPMFMIWRRSCDENGGGHLKLTFAVGTFSIFVASIGVLAAVPLSRLVPNATADLSIYIASFAISVPVVALVYFLSAFFFQPDGESWIIARGAMLSAAANLVYLFALIIYGAKPIFFALCPHVAEGAVLIYYSCILYRRFRSSYVFGSK